MKFAVPLVALALALAGCLGGADDPVDVNNVELSITSTKNADGSFTFSAPALAGVTYVWDLGDLTSTKTGAEVRHKYGVANGMFSVVLSATDAAGKIVRLGKQHQVGTGLNAAPTAKINLTNQLVKAGAAFAVDGSASMDPDGDSLKVTWLAVPAASAAASGGHGGHGGHLLEVPTDATRAETGGDGHGGHQHAAGGINVDVAAGKSATVAFPKAGLYQIHCHPHPWMVAKILVADGAPKNASADIEQNSYLPGTLRVAPGGSIKFTNKDKMLHTVTESAFVPKGTVLPLTTLKGEITLADKGAFDLVLAVEDGKGQMSVATKRIVVGDEEGSATYETEFAGGWTQPTVVALSAERSAARHAFEIKYPGHAVVAATVTKSANAVGDVQFRLLDAMGTEIAVGTDMQAQIPAGQYFVEAAPTSGSHVMNGVEYSIAVLVHLDLEGGAAGGDGHGDHQH